LITGVRFTNLSQLSQTGPEIEHEHLVGVVEFESAFDYQFDVGAKQRNRKNHVFYEGLLCGDFTFEDQRVFYEVR
ncbi:MAG: hypothetical protein ACK56F_21480, partial [bacterium]